MYVYNGVYMQALPDYYKRRIFNFSAPKKERLVEENAARMVDEYWKEIERLMELHPLPESYYEERMVFALQSIKSKANAKDVL